MFGYCTISWLSDDSCKNGESESEQEMSRWTATPHAGQAQPQTSLENVCGRIFGCLAAQCTGQGAVIQDYPEQLPVDLAEMS